MAGGSKQNPGCCIVRHKKRRVYNTCELMRFPIFPWWLFIRLPELPPRLRSFLRAAWDVLAFPLLAVCFALALSVLAISKHTAPINREALYADVDAMMSQYLEIDIGSMNLGEMLQQVLDVAQKHRLTMPPGVTMLGRGISTLEGLVADISPNVNVMEIVSQRFAHTAFRDIDWNRRWAAMPSRCTNRRRNR